MSATKVTQAHVPTIGRRHEVLGILGAALTILVFMSLASYDGSGGENWIGPVGTFLASILAGTFGWASWVIPLELGLATARLFRRHTQPFDWAVTASTLVLLIVSCALAHLALPEITAFGTHLAGGLLGEFIGEILRSVMGLAGAFIVCVAILLITVVLRTSLSVIGVTMRAATASKVASETAVERARALWTAWREARAIEAEEAEEAAYLAEKEAKAAAKEARKKKKDERTAALALGANAIAGEEFERTTPGSENSPESWEEEEQNAKALILSNENEDIPAAEIDAAFANEEEESKPKKQKIKAPTIVAPVAMAPKAPTAPSREREKTTVVPSIGQPFVLPPNTLLDAGSSSKNIRVDEKVLKDNAARLVEKLAAYGVQGQVDEIHPGPVVTMYEFEPASGTKVSKIAGLADDLAMALAAQKVRIVAPIPGKARVGFELPNRDRQSVALREICEDERWNSMKAALPIALGKDISGQPVYGDLAKMPHLLVAGATGAGKSVGINVMLTSLLMKKSPEEVRFLMIDPKVVELAVFDRIPHMLLPVVTDMKKAALALRWAVDEMERRYQLFADAGARSIVTYNERVERVLRGEMSAEKLMPTRAGKMRGIGPNGEEVLLNPDEDDVPDAVEQTPQKLPYVVVVVDEFADLMMVAAKDVEAAVARLAQKARAAGIHVILATQRPSVDVITGMIKANFPARIAFKVSQREDSKTILGRSGAEHLLGMGDMLMIPPGSSDLKRVHCAYISEDEVKGVCDFLRAQGTPIYDNEILKPREDEDGEMIGGGLGEGGESDDPLYDKAVAVVAQAGYCSISHIQRQLSVGYNKAAKLVERMEKEGIVGSASNKAGGRREVLVQSF